jgi:hypothetical protein
MSTERNKYCNLVGELPVFLDSLYTKKRSEVPESYGPIVCGIKNVLRNESSEVFANWHVRLRLIPNTSNFDISLDAKGKFYETVFDMIDHILYGDVNGETLLLVAFMELALRDEPYCLDYHEKHMLTPSDFWYYRGNDIVIRLT